MPVFSEISADKLMKLIGTPACPVLMDVRDDAAFAADPRLIPSSVRRDTAAGPAIVIGEHGEAEAHGVAARLRAAGVDAEVLEGGVAAWSAAGRPMVPSAALPQRDASGRTVWVTRARPKVDRIACPWLIRRFVDPTALFLFVPGGEVEAVAARFGGVPFDIAGDGTRWTHDGDRCTFDAMADGFGLGGIGALDRLATIVRGADTARPDLAPEAAGLLAVSLGLSRMYSDDIAQLDAGMLMYDALYRWCRDATDETHDWTAHAKRVKA